MKQSRIKSIFKQLLKSVPIIFQRDVALYASSLSFYTVFTIVPVLIVTLSLISNMDIFSQQNSNIQQLIFSNIMPVQSETINGYLTNFKNELTSISTIGAISIFVSSIFFFNNFEEISSRIFKVENRSVFSSIKTYILLVTLTPTVLITSTTLQIYLSSHVTGFLLFLVSIFPFLLLWSMFFIIYKVAVNHRIFTLAAAISSFIVTIAWGIAKIVFIKYAFYSQAHSTIYGSLSIFIFFFLWIYTSWIIVIYGMKICELLNLRIEVKKKQGRKKTHLG